MRTAIAIMFVGWLYAALGVAAVGGCLPGSDPLNYAASVFFWPVEPLKDMLGIWWGMTKYVVAAVMTCFVVAFFAGAISQIVKKD